MLDRSNTDSTYMERIIISDETCLYEFDMQTGQQASGPKISQNRPKLMFIVFFDIRGVEQ